MHRKLLGIINVDLDAAVHLLIIYFAFIKYLKWEYNEAVCWLSVDFKKTYDSVRIEVFLLSLVSP